MLHLRSQPTQPKHYPGSETNGQLKYTNSNQPTMSLTTEKMTSYDLPANYITSPRSNGKSNSIRIRFFFYQ